MNRANQAYFRTVVTLAILFAAALVQISVSGASAASPAASAHGKTQWPPGSGWRLTFHDDFNGKRLNTKLWNTCWTNRPASRCTNFVEAQWYRSANVALSRGYLHLTAKRQRDWLKVWHCCKYTSGMVTTSGRKSFRYGFFEARIKYPPGVGFWTAFWLNPANYSPNTEIDAAEHIGAEPTLTMQAYHYNLGKKGAAKNLPVFATRTMESRWHTYSVDWEPHIIRWYVDGRLTNSFSRCHPGHRPLPPPNNACGPITAKQMSLTLNFALAGAKTPWGKPVNKKTPFPSTVLVDYVRVWTKKAW